MKMKIAIASDHRGTNTKQQIADHLAALGLETLDLGPNDDSVVDYPDYALRVGEAVVSGQADRGILICGTGLGMCIAANKIHGVRAVTCHDDVTAEMSRRHNDANVMCISADLLGDKLLGRIVEIWINTQFEGGRHTRRLEKITKIEQDQAACHSKPSES